MKPPPMAKPLTAPITGFSSAPVMNGSSCLGRSPPATPFCSDSFMSSPAQKPRPVPVKIATSSSLLCLQAGQCGAHLVVERIQPVGPVHADYEHLPVTFGFDDGHVCSLRAGGRP